MSAISDYYKTLNVGMGASREDVIAAYRTAAKRFHPDRFRSKSAELQQEGTRRMQAVNEAYDILKDPERRRAYDRIFVAATTPRPRSDTNPIHRQTPPPAPAKAHGPSAASSQSAGQRTAHQGTIPSRVAEIRKKDRPLHRQAILFITTAVVVVLNGLFLLSGQSYLSKCDPKQIMGVWRDQEGKIWDFSSENNGWHEGHRVYHQENIHATNVTAAQCFSFKLQIDGTLCIKFFIDGKEQQIIMNIRVIKPNKQILVYAVGQSTLSLIPMSL